MDFAEYTTPFGILRIEYEDSAITFFKVIPQAEPIPGNPTVLTETAYFQFMEYIAGKRKELSFPIRMKGTEFQKKVWRALQEIPYGVCKSYREIAVAIGSPKAYRAVGNANNKNPLTVIVPCHRVVGSDGSLVGYACGLEMKRCLLEIEHRYK